jgi:membrane protein
MSLLKLLKKAFHAWMKDKAPRMGAALAFYTVFSLAPLLILVIAVGGLFFGESVAQTQIITQIAALIGQEGGQAVATLIEAARRPSSGVLATIIGILTLLIGSTGALVELQDGLNRVWKVRDDTGFAILLRQRLMSLALILGIAFLLLVSLVVSAIIAALGTFVSGHVPATEWFWHGSDFIVSCAVVTVLFAMIFKILPDTSVRWNDVWIGATATSILFTLGKFLMGLYIGKSAITSAYGAAGSFVVVLMWVYYSAVLLYYGAEFTKAYADAYGSRKDS